MKRKLFSALLLLLLCLSLATPALATQNSRLIFDNADLLSGSEERQLQRKLESLRDEYKAQVIVVTVNSTGGYSADGFVEHFYDSNQLGYGPDRDGVMLLISMDERDYRILSNGYVADAITPNEIDAIGDAIVSDLSDGEYADAFLTFADQCEYYIDGHLNGFPFDAGKTLLIALVIGAVVGLIVVLILKGQLKSVRRRNEADLYMKAGSMHITHASDLYLYRNVSRIRRQTNSSGGSSRGSSGGRHVGGGKF